MGLLFNYQIYGIYKRCFKDVTKNFKRCYCLKKYQNLSINRKPFRKNM